MWHMWYIRVLRFFREAIAIELFLAVNPRSLVTVMIREPALQHAQKIYKVAN